MRQVPQEVTRFLREKYPKPIVDEEWLEGCYNWTVSDLGLIPATQMDAILHNVESQLLQSNLSDSMRPSTGLPPTVSQIQKGTLTGAPILVEIISLTEIGNSAYNLMNVRQQRIDRADLAGLNANNDNNDDGEDEGPVPKYPRSMLRFQLSDGSTTLEAIELKCLPGLELGETPLGYKMQLKDVFIRQGIAFLEPRSVVMKGHKTAERDEDRDKDFVNSLKDRLGVPRDEEPYVPPPQPAAPPHMPQQPPAVRSPLRELPPSPPPIAGPSNPTSHTTNSFPNTHDEELPRQRRRKVPSRPTNRTPTPSPPPRERPSQLKPPSRSQPRTSQPKGSQNQKLSSSQLQRQLTLSRFFPGGGGSNETSTTSSVKGKGKVAELANELMFSPHRQSAAAMNMDGGGDPDSDEEEAFRSIHMDFSPKPTKEQKPPTFLGSKAKGKEFKVYRDPDPNESNTNNDGDNEPPLPDGYDANMEEDSNSEFGFSFDFDLKEVDKAEKEALGLLSDGSYKGQAETQVGDGPSTTAGRSSRSQTLVGSTAGFDSTGGHSGHDTENSKSSTSRNPPSSSSVSGTGSGSGGSVPLRGPHATEGNGTATNGQSHSEVQPPLGTQAAPIAIDDDDDDLFFSSNTRSGGRAEVISIDDTDNEGEGEEEIDKENVPVMVRRQRRRVLPEGTIIDISED